VELFDGHGVALTADKLFAERRRSEDISDVICGWLWRLIAHGRPLPQRP
jgi:hypothetical protein